MATYEGTSKNGVWAGSGLLSALLATVCCWGPVLLSGVAGLSGSSSLISWLHPLSPYLKGLAVLSLGIAFYQVYVKEKGAKEGRGSCCSTDPSVEKKRRGQKRMLWAVTPLVLLAFLFPYIAPAFGAGEPAAEQGGAVHTGVQETQDKTEKLVLEIKGMTCMGCQKRIHDALSEMEGVKELEVSHEDGSGVVNYHPELTGPDSILAKIEELGYEAKVKGD